MIVIYYNFRSKIIFCYNKYYLTAALKHSSGGVYCWHIYDIKYSLKYEENNPLLIVG